MTGMQMKRALPATTNNLSSPVPEAKTCISPVDHPAALGSVGVRGAAPDEVALKKRPSKFRPVELSVDLPG